MLSLFQEHIAQQKLFHSEERILLAFSAGIDSVVLAELLLASKFKIGIAHVNFQLRGNESDENENFAKAFAEKYSLAFYSIRFDTLAFAAQEKISIQMAARKLRYDWFEEIRLQENYDSIVTAHHLSDSIETFFINLSRGTGIAGLHGISLHINHIKRPLLPFTKKEITAYAAKNNFAWQEDSSNQKDAYLRNHIRHNIVPEFEKINPSFAHQMDELLLEISEVEKIKNNWLSDLQKIGLEKKDGHICIAIDWLKSLMQGKYFLSQTLKSFGFSITSSNDCWKALDKQSGIQFFSASHRLVKDRTHLLIETLSEEQLAQQAAATHFLWQPSQMVLDLGPFVIEGLESTSVPALDQLNSNQACLNADLLVFPLQIRKWQAADSFQPLGMQGNKKLSDFFIDEKFSLIEKDNTFVMVSGTDIVWVIGHRISEKYKVNQNCKSTYLFNIK
jgi:tRNA(Ile)-lysidine synthase